MEIVAGNRRVHISRPEKVLFPDDGLTKADVAEYYARVADTMLPHVRDRPVHMRRFPDGIAGRQLEQKQVPPHFPSWIERVPVPRKAGGTVVQIVCNSPATLVYLADQACIEPHVWSSRRDRLDRPDLLVFDLDPPGAYGDAVRDGAYLLRELLSHLGLVPFVKATGSRGVHVVCPLERRSDFESVRAFARAAAELLAGRHPDRLTVEQRKPRRLGRVFIDVMRNGYAQTVIAPYALRARSGAPVAAPLDWDELDEYAPSRYTIHTILGHLERRGDPWSGLHREARSLREPRRRLDALRSRGRAEITVEADRPSNG